MPGKLAIALLIAAGLPLLAPAQQLRGPLINISAPTAGTFGGRSPFPFATNRGPMTRFHHSGAGLATPYLYPDYPYADYSAEPAEAAPQVFVVQVPTVVEAPAKESKASPLLIEWNGDRYVSMSDANNNAGRMADTQFDVTEPASPKITTSRKKPQAIAPAPTELTPVVLIYRDGRREQIRDYTIVDGIIYARGDYWSDGYWNKKIQLAALNLPASIKASQIQGAKLILPASPNEVVIRP